MEDGLDLKAFLADQAGEGRVDSQGSFTVAREKALQKLAHFALPESYDWVLKLVQAANIWKAPRLVVKQTRIATSFSFRPPQGQLFPSETAIMEALNNPVLDRDNPVHAIAMALRSLVEQARLSFVLAVRQHGEMGKPIFAGDDAKSLAPATREAWTHLANDGVRLTVSHFQGSESLTGRYVPTFSRQERRDIEILKKLEDRCFASAVPIEVDGRSLGVVFPRGDYFKTHHLRPLLLGRFPEGATPLERLEDVQLLSGHIPRDGLRVSASADRPGQAWLLISGSDWRTESATYQRLSGLLMPLGRSEEPSYHRVWWTRQGVIVAQYRFAANCHPDAQLQLFLPSDHVRTDLSGLKIEMVAPPSVEARQLFPPLAREFAALLATPQARQRLLAQPADQAVAPAPSGATPGQIETLDGSGETTFSGDLLPEMPTLGLGMLQALGNAAHVLAHLPGHERRLERWADRALAQVEGVQRDLEAMFTSQR